MHVLLVYCHPRADSFCAALRDAAIGGLETAGHTVEIRDLYAEDFVPALSAEERGRSPSWLLWLIGRPDRRLVGRGLRRVCARGCRLDWAALTRMDTRTRPERERFVAQVQARFARW